jgi:hypothetical protein
MACDLWVKWKQSSDRKEKSVTSLPAALLFGMEVLMRNAWPTTAKSSLELYRLLAACNSEFYWLTETRTEVKCA